MTPTTKGNREYTWHELKQVWRSYKMARLHDDKDKMDEFAKRITEIQIAWGCKTIDFPELANELSTSGVSGN